MSDAMTLWLDGMDILGTERGSYPQNPTASQTLPTWYNKQLTSTHWAGNASPPPRTSFDPYFSSGFGVDYYAGTNGVYFRGTNSALEVTNNDIIFTIGDVFIAATPTAYTNSSILWNSPATADNTNNRISIHLPWSDGTVYWDYGSAGSPGRITYGGGVPMNTGSTWRFKIKPGEQSISRRGIVVSSTTNTLAYVPPLGSRRLIGMGFAHGSTAGPYPGFQGTIHEIIAFARNLSVTEAAILNTYLAGKYNIPDDNNLMDFSKGYRFHIGGVGSRFVSEGARMGTSAGLRVDLETYSNDATVWDTTTFGVSSFYPAVGLTSGELGYSGYMRGRSARVWYVHQYAPNATGAGKMTMTFNLNTGVGVENMGIAADAGSRAALIYRASATAQWTIIATSTVQSNKVSFATVTRRSGFYAVALDYPPTPSIASTTSVSLVSDPVNSTTNPKLIPGARADVTLTATNSGTGTPDNNTSVLQAPIPAGMKLVVGDLGAANSGPVAFTPNSSGLSYTYSGLSNTTDSLDFSNNNGSTWTYTPVLDVDKADPAVTHLRIRPTGSFAPSSSITARWRVVIK